MKDDGEASMMGDEAQGMPTNNYSVVRVPRELMPVLMRVQEAYTIQREKGSLFMVIF